MESEKPKLLWNVNVLGAYIKRRANLILMAEGQETVTAADLARCLEEFFENLEAGGVRCALLIQTTFEITPEHGPGDGRIGAASTPNWKSTSKIGLNRIDIANR